MLEKKLPVLEMVPKASHNLFLVITVANPLDTTCYMEPIQEGEKCGNVKSIFMAAILFSAPISHVLPAFQT